LTTLLIFSDILKEFIQLAALLPSPFIPYPGAKGGRDRIGVNHQPQSLKNGTKTDLLLSIGLGEE
jgi:hypothetical protein